MDRSLDSGPLTLHGENTRGLPMCSCQILFASNMELGMTFVQKESSSGYHTLHQLNLKVDNNSSHKEGRR